ncbi:MULTISPECIES: lipopolysaccharide biosynthesis protein [Psychrilyobacter]|uniref:Polysaccharide biosynthesis protein n=1 Tax=Psychrilyobacter piezotolerans TaxID=2293438 RepID=A0ABX9KDQ8_9FUSO|nr:MULTISPECIES: hypothetical protein [Psychrilyobacter]MCS5422125.1 hypothetical protein [Psychrilyobacter sp. S5]NDI76278.1 hypothetical protein [Psychrilyobacter piezotolerans]RDE59163.1 hypothetical protein DV867_13615 [Psychrilyobacter sp. S5]REI39725.1 hypothetical protein DYH56_13615 [Psychrilyobacter piezotolerans]
MKKSHDSQLKKNITGSFLIKGLGIIVSMFTMPVYMTFFSDQVILGVWFTLISMLNWILNFDLGIGNGLRNHLVIALSEKSDKKIKQYISSAYIILGSLSIGIIIIGYLFIGFINWNMILNISPEILPNGLLLKVVRILFVGIIAQFFLRLIVSILYAMQKTVLPSILALISSILLLLYMKGYTSVNIEQSLNDLAIINVLTMNVPLLVTTIALFLTKLKKSKPSLKFYVKNYARNIMKLGGEFFFIQIMSLVMVSTNLMLITWLYDPKYVVEYQVYFKLFNLFVVLFSLIVNPIWSAVSKAYVEKNYTWIKKIYNYLNILSIVATLACFFLIFFLQYIVSLWLGENSIIINYSYAFYFAVNSSLIIYTLAITSIANGIGSLKPQIYCNVIMATMKFPLAYILSFVVGGWGSIILTNIILMTPCVIFQSIMINKTLKNKKIILIGKGDL